MVRGISHAHVHVVPSHRVHGHGPRCLYRSFLSSLSSLRNCFVGETSPRSRYVSGYGLLSLAMNDPKESNGCK